MNVKRAMNEEKLPFPYYIKFLERKNALYYLDKIFLSCKKINMNDTILISGSPRSGTTWLMEILGTIPEYSYLYEPFNPTWFPESKEIGFRSRTYLPSNVDWHEGEKYLRKVFSGQIISTIPYYRHDLKTIMNRVLCKKLLVKVIHLNRLLPWISQRFSLRSIVFIIRNPCAVVASQLKTGYYGYHSEDFPYIRTMPTLKDILNEASMIDGLDDALYTKLKKIESKEEILAVAWCLDNFVPLNTFRNNSILIVKYEKLLKNGVSELNRIFNAIGEPTVTKNAFRYLHKPSMLTPKEKLKTVTKKEKQLSDWKKKLNSKQVDRILKVVSYFNLDLYADN